MKKSRWIWMPHPAHYILANKCQFTLATYVGKYIVSTVGELWPDRDSRRINAKISDPEWWAKNKSLLGDNFDRAYFERFGFETIGYNIKYETMVFRARRMPKDRCSACPYEPIIHKQLDFLGYNDPLSAYKGHLELCNKWSKQ